MAADCLLTEVEFRDLAVAFCKKQHDLGARWEVKVHKSKNGSSDIYVTSERVVDISAAQKQLKSPTLIPTEDSAVVQEEECEDDSLAVCERPAAICVTYHYHIVYSHTYQVPVLYFSCCHGNGQSLSLEDIWSHVPEMHEERVASDSWSVISQGEHPILEYPFFFVHPCHTAASMRAVWGSGGGADYLTSWLSMVGPLVGVHLPLPNWTSQLSNLPCPP